MMLSLVNIGRKNANVFAWVVGDDQFKDTSIGYNMCLIYSQGTWVVARILLCCVCAIPLAFKVCYKKSKSTYY